MNDFFTGLIERSIGAADIIRPVIPSRYAPALTSELMEHEEFTPIAKGRDAPVTNQRDTHSDRGDAPQDSDEGYRFLVAEFHDGKADVAQGLAAESNKDIGADRNHESEGETNEVNPPSVRGHRPFQPPSKGTDQDRKTRQFLIIQPQIKISKPATEATVKEKQRGRPDSAKEDAAYREINTVRVHIGRIEVRAIMPPPAPARKESTQQKPLLTLEDYLKQRGKGTR